MSSYYSQRYSHDSVVSVPSLTKKNSFYLSLAQKSVESVNELLVGINTDLLDAKTIVRERNIHNGNLQELLALVQTENKKLKDEILLIRQEMLRTQEHWKKREFEMNSQAEEKLLVSESELERVLEQHQHTLKLLDYYQTKVNDAQTHEVELEKIRRQFEYEIKDKDFKIGRLETEIMILKEKLEESQKFQQLLESAHEEVMVYRLDKISRDREVADKYEEELKSLRSQLEAVNEKYRDLNFENTLLKASQRSPLVADQGDGEEVDGGEPERKVDASSFSLESISRTAQREAWKAAFAGHQEEEEGTLFTSEGEVDLFNLTLNDINKYF